MAYNEFTFAQVRDSLGITIVEEAGRFASVTPIMPSAVFGEIMRRNMPLLTGVDTEKARSEWLIAPLLVEVRELLNRAVGVFSGPDLDVDKARGLNGYCDFLITGSPSLLEVGVPLIAVVEAKRERLAPGIPQCVAEMYAARLLNEREGHPNMPVYGVVTSGTTWRFLELVGSTAFVDIQDCYIDNPDQIIGVLIHLIRTAIAASTLAA